MFANQRVMMLKQKIIEHHGRVQEIYLYDKEPTDEDLVALAEAKNFVPVKQDESEDEEDTRKRDDDDDQPKVDKAKKAKAAPIEVEKPNIQCFDNDSHYLH